MIHQLTSLPFVRNTMLNLSEKKSVFEVRDIDESPGEGVHPGEGEGVVLSHIGYIGTCGPKGYGFFNRFGLK